MYRRTIAIVVMLLTLTGAATAYAASDTETAVQSLSSTQGSQDNQVSTCSWPPSPSSDRGACNTCAVACRAGQVAVCTPGIVDDNSSACVRQPECTCR